LDKVVNAIPGVNMVAALTGATKPAGAGRRRRRGGAGLVDDLEGGAIPDFEEMSLTKLRQLYKALDDRPQPTTKDELIESIAPYFDVNEVYHGVQEAPRRRQRRAASPSPSPQPAPKKKGQSAEYYRQRYARRKAARQAAAGVDFGLE
jgi:hypothetical protein